MNIENIPIQDLFRDGTLTANGVRIILQDEQERREFQRAEELSCIITPDLAAYIKRRQAESDRPKVVDILRKRRPEY
jgi:hypothetical protein